MGKENIQVVETNNNNNVAQMNMSDLLALANSSVNSVGGVGSINEADSVE
ncbi:hypothetical protein HpHCM85_11030 [Helicobacter pylori]